MNPITVASTRRAATDRVASLHRPATISPCRWRPILELLKVIARRVPNCWPSEQTLADEVGCNVRSIRRHIAAAVEAGLLLVEADGGCRGRKGPSKTNRYHIVTTDNLSPLDEDRKSNTQSRTPSEYSRETPSPASQETIVSPRGPGGPRGSLRPLNRATRARLVASMLRRPDEEPSRSVGAAPPSRRPAKRAARSHSPDGIVVPLDSRRRKKRSTPLARRCAEYFVTAWAGLVARNPEYDRIRADESFGQMATYIKAHFLGPAPKTEEEIHRLIDDFVRGVSRGDITIKDKQSAWMKFCGSWGRLRPVDYGAELKAYDDYFGRS